jgi:hypothetical protein
MLDVRLSTEHPPSPHGPADKTPAWTDATTERPCPVCGAPRGCSVIEGGAFARCLHTPSRWPVLGGGWLHQLAEQSAAPVDDADPPAERTGSAHRESISRARIRPTAPGGKTPERWRNGA